MSMTKATSSSNEPGNASEIVDLAPQRPGLLSTWTDLGVDVAEEVVRGSFGILQDVRHETAERLGSVIDFVDGLNQGVLQVGRKVNDRVDRITCKTIDSGEKALLSVLRRPARQTERSETTH